MHSEGTRRAMLEIAVLYDRIAVMITAFRGRYGAADKQWMGYVVKKDDHRPDR
jgi:hypothetical protein